MTDPFAIGDELLAQQLNDLKMTFTVQKFTASGTWIKPDGLSRLYVRVMGGGGTGGGGAATGVGQNANSGGGGGGGYAEKLLLASNLASTETVDIGAGGTPPAAGNNVGGTGGTSTFATGKGYAVSATGGVGGGGSPASPGQQIIAGGVGGAGAGGDFNFDGGPGGRGIILAGVVNQFMNNGGSSLWAPIVYPPIAVTQGTAGKLYGGGSSGIIQIASSAALAPLAGGAGLVVVWNCF